MAVLALVNSSEITREIYDAIRPAVDWVGNPPAGLIMHACSFDEQGGMHVADIWDSPESMFAFFESRLLPALQAQGVAAPDKPEIHVLHNLDVLSTSA
jgi:hypothetical protein